MREDSLIRFRLGIPDSIQPGNALAEKFHMSEELLSTLNPEQKFDNPGEQILVVNVTTKDRQQTAARIEIDKSKQTLKAFGRSDELLAFYPVTAGREERPTPSGRLKVTGVSKRALALPGGPEPPSSP